MSSCEGSSDIYKGISFDVMNRYVSLDSTREGRVGHLDFSKAELCNDNDTYARGETPKARAIMHSASHWWETKRNPQNSLQAHQH